MQGGPRNHSERGRPPNPPNQNFQPTIPGQLPQNRMPMQPSSSRGPTSAQQQQQMQQKKTRYFLAMFDYDPMTMSPNPDSCEEELPFREGDTIKVNSFIVSSSHFTTYKLINILGVWR